jgi:hypothetical protein
LRTLCSRLDNARRRGLIGVSVMPVLFGTSGSTGLALVVPGILVLIVTGGRLGLPKK